jgi:P pilus assembly chaperone PapD
MRLFHKHVGALCGLIAAVMPVVPAKAAITITPTLVVIEGRARYADVNLVNSGDLLSTYAIGWRYYKMEEGTGGYLNSEGSTTDFDLGKNMIFTPRRIAIDPQQVQKIRLGLRLKGEPPPPGDYRAHLELKEVPADAAAPAQDKKPGQRGASVGVKVNVGFTIPVVYRVGESDAKVEIGKIETRINQKSGRIEVLVPATKSKSNFGILGRLEIYYKDDLVGQVKNANIFPEINQRTFKIPLTVNTMSGGSLHIVYKDFHKDQDNILTEKTVPVGR